MKLAVIPNLQQTAYSCVASVLQAIALFHGLGNFTHEQAIQMVQAEPNGAELEMINKALGYDPYPINGTFKNFYKCLDEGYPIITDDNITYEDPHAILLIGYTRKGFYIFDPAEGKILWRPKNWLRKASSEFHILYRTDTEIV